MLRPGVKYIYCGLCKNPYQLGALQYRECPHPDVRTKKGRFICVYCCTRCKYGDCEGIGVGCNYGKNNEKNNSVD